MATNDGVDITICAICLEQLNIPKQLPCLHTFCESCITTYIKAVFEKTNASVDCPVCRSTVGIQGNDIDAEGYVNKLPTNICVSTVIERRKLLRPEKVCMSCERMDASTESVAVFVCVSCSDSLCQTCVNYHKSNKSSAHHKLLPIADLSPENLVSYPLMCNEHTDKQLEVFCAHHNEFCCLLCILRNHRWCNKVLSLGEAAKNFIEQNSMTGISDLADKVQSDLTNIVDNARSAIYALDKNKSSEMKRLVVCFKRIHIKLDDLESAYRQEYEKMFDAERNRLETVITEFENKQKIVLSFKGILKTVKDECSDIHMMVEGQKIKRKLSRINSYVGISYKEQKIEMNFENLEAIEEKAIAFCTELSGLHESSTEEYYDSDESYNDLQQRDQIEDSYTGRWRDYFGGDRREPIRQPFVRYRCGRLGYCRKYFTKRRDRLL